MLTYTNKHENENDFENDVVPDSASGQNSLFFHVHDNFMYGCDGALTPRTMRTFIPNVYIYIYWIKKRGSRVSKNQNKEK